MYQLVVVQKITSCAWFEPDRKPGDIVWVRSEHAVRHLLENGLCRWPSKDDETPFGPNQAKAPPDAEVKGTSASLNSRAEGIARPKFCGEPMPGRTIGSPWSTRCGAARLSSASAAALLVPRRI